MNGTPQPLLDNADQRVLWILARQLRGLSVPTDLSQLPGPWAEHCRLLALAEVKDRQAELHCMLSSWSNDSIQQFFDAIEAVDPDSPDPATPFPFPTPIIDGKRETESSKLKTFSLQELLNMPDIQIEWLVQDLIPVQGIAILGGPPGKGKSWMLLDLALACNSGRLWMGRFQTKRGRVLYIDEESPPALLKHRIQRLLRSANGHTNQNDVSIALGEGLCLARPASVDQLRRTIKDSQPALVIIDSLIRVHGSEENSASEMAKVFAEVKELVRNYGCSVVFADHQRKPGMGHSSQDQMLRGTTEKVAFVDTLLSLHQKDNTLVVEHTKSRFAQPVPSFVIAIEDPDPDSTVVRVVGDAETVRKEARQEQAAELVTQLLSNGRWKSRKELKLAASKVRVPVKAVDDILTDWHRDGLIEREDRKPESGRGGKSAYYRLARSNDPISRFTSNSYMGNGNGVTDDSIELF